MAIFSSNKNRPRVSKTENAKRSTVTKYYRTEKVPQSTSPFTKEVTQQFRQIINRNKITFNQNNLSEALQKKFPEIVSAQTELPFFSERPVVRLAIAKPSFILQSKSQQYIVNKNGIAVDRASNLSDVKNLPLIDDQSGYDVKPGTKVLSASSVNFIDNLIKQLNKARVPIKSTTLPSAPEELIIRTQDQNYYVKLYLGGDVLNQAGQFLAARDKFKKDNILPHEYLDLRINGKIFYK
jgi:hypothetical protein